MGCKAFTPPLVGLAKELEGRPFHLIASHNQRGDAAGALHEIFQNGLGLDASNVTVTKHGNHPGVRGTGYVPYYLLFDHHGDLVHHHQGGPYHGGDGTALLDRVRSMLEDVPVVYTGKAPFERHAQLARELAEGKKLRASLPKLARALEASPQDDELLRLSAAVEAHLTRFIEDRDADLVRDPSDFFERLDTYTEATAATRWAPRLTELGQSFDRSTRKRSQVAAKQIAQLMKRWTKLEPVRGTRAEVLNPFDADFRRRNKQGLAALGQQWRGVATEYAELAAGKYAGALAALFEGTGGR